VFRQRYQAELEYLRALGREIARDCPALEPVLAEAGGDAAVEHLLQGSAFIGARVRERLDELSEVTHALLAARWPRYLRPTPALALVEFEPAPKMLTEPRRIPRGTELDSSPVDGVSCRFRTTAELELQPLRLASARLETPPGSRGTLRLGFRLEPGARPEALSGRLRLHLTGTPERACALHLHLTRHLREAVLRGPDGERRLPEGAVRPGGEDDEPLLPEGVLVERGLRLLDELLLFPQKFRCVDVAPLPPLAEVGAEEEFELELRFERPDAEALQLEEDGLRLHCVPAVNLVQADSHSIPIEARRLEYLVRPDLPGADRVEIHSVDRVVGWRRGTVEQQEYQPFQSLEAITPTATPRGAVFYQVRLCASVVDRGFETYLSFVGTELEKTAPGVDSVTATLTCTQHDRPNHLAPGDLCRPTASTPSFARFRNVGPVSPSVPAPLEEPRPWALLSALAFSPLAAERLEGLREALRPLHLRALADRQVARDWERRLAALRGLRSRTRHRVVRGAPVRVTERELEVDPEAFDGRGELALFGRALSGFLALHAPRHHRGRLWLHTGPDAAPLDFDADAGAQPLV